MRLGIELGPIEDEGVAVLAAKPVSVAVGLGHACMPATLPITGQLLAGPLEPDDQTVSSVPSVSVLDDGSRHLGVSLEDATGRELLGHSHRHFRRRW